MHQVVRDDRAGRADVGPHVAVVPDEGSILRQHVMVDDPVDRLALGHDGVPKARLRIHQHKAVEAIDVELFDLDHAEA
jgi:hypothetical protein